MRLTLFTDYSLRLLLYLGSEPDRLCSIPEVAKSYGISQNHMMKVAHGLVRSGYVESVRGRSGGLRLGRPATDINIGTVVRLTEGHIELVDCDSCVLTGACGMTGILKQALSAFFQVLDRYTLDDLLRSPADMRALLGSRLAEPERRG